MLGYLTYVRVSFLFLVFGVGAAVVNVYAYIRTRGFALGIPDLLSGAIVITLGSAVFKILMTRIVKAWR